MIDCAKVARYAVDATTDAVDPARICNPARIIDIPAKAGTQRVCLVDDAVTLGSRFRGNDGMRGTQGNDGTQRNDGGWVGGSDVPLTSRSMNAGESAR